jgi:hypothetical protein
VVRSTASDPLLEARLSALVASARSLVTGVTLPVWRTVGRFFTVVFPAAVYRARRWWISVAVLNILVAALIAWRMINTPGRAESLLLNHRSNGWSTTTSRTATGSAPPSTSAVRGVEVHPARQRPPAEPR